MYVERIGALAKARPHLANLLRSNHDSRSERLDALRDGARLRGIDELLGHLHRVEEAFATNKPLADIAFLIARAREDFEVSLEVTLMCYISVAHGQMRDVMEIEFLLWDFLLEPTRMQRWLSADHNTLMREFQPQKVRQRLYENGGLPWIGKKGESSDYQGHSASLHVTPLAFPWDTHDDEFIADAAFWEIFEHGRRLLLAIQMYKERFPDSGLTGLQDMGELSFVKDAWARTRMMQDLFLAAMRGKEGLREYIAAIEVMEDPYPGWLSREELQALGEDLPQREE